MPTTKPLYQRRLDALRHVGKSYSNLSLTDKDVLLILSHNWPGLDELDEVLQKVASGNQAAIEQHCKHWTLDMVLNKLIESGMRPSHYRRLNSLLFGGLLPHYMGKDGQGNNVGFKFYVYASSVNVQSGVSFIESGGWKIGEIDAPSPVLLKRCSAITGSEISMVNAQKILTLLEWLYGSDVVEANKPVFSLQPFPESALGIIRTALYLIKNKYQKGDMITIPGSLAGFEPKLHGLIKKFLEGCKRAAERNLYPDDAINYEEMRSGPKRGGLSLAVECMYNELKSKGSIDIIAKNNVQNFVETLKENIEVLPCIKDNISKIEFKDDSWRIYPLPKPTKGKEWRDERAVSKILSKLRKELSLPE